MSEVGSSESGARRLDRVEASPSKQQRPSQILGRRGFADTITDRRMLAQIIRVNTKYCCMIVTLLRRTVPA